MNKDILCLYYSRTGHTKFAMEEIAAALDCECVEMRDRVDRDGAIGWLRCGLDAGRSRRDVKELCGVSYDFVFDKLSAAAKSYSAETLAELVALSAEYDFRMKGGDSKADPAALLRELFARIAAAK